MNVRAMNPVVQALNAILLHGAQPILLNQSPPSVGASYPRYQISNINAHQSVSPIDSMESTVHIGEQVVWGEGGAAE